MSQIPSSSTALSLISLNHIQLPVEMWCMIFRFLDPVSLIKASRAHPFWDSVIRGDSILMERIRQYLEMLSRVRQEQ
ncbi:F-box-like domain containing protein, partial [Asbolus verrucosus]